MNKQVSNEDEEDYPVFSPEFMMLAATASYLQKDLEEMSDLWKNSPFEWVIQLPPRSKSKLARSLITSWFASKGILAERTKTTNEILILNGNSYAIKFSMLWKSGVYQFQQIKVEGPEYILCFGISPYDAHCWVFERDYAIKHGKQQHTGAKGADYWLEINTNNIPEWAQGHGGTLEEAYHIIKTTKQSK